MIQKCLRPTSRLLVPVAVPMQRLLTALTLGFVVIGALAGCERSTSPSTPQSPLPEKRRIVLLGLDAGTWDVLDPMIEAGKLPNLARLRAGGASGVLRSIQPSSSPVIWTSIATGKSPEKHGITFFVRFPDGRKGGPKPVNRTMRQSKTLWNIFSDRGLDVAVVGWFVTWPAEEVNGRLLSDHAHYPSTERANVAFPPSYMSSFKLSGQHAAISALTEFMDFKYDPSELDPKSSDPGERLNFLVFDRFVRAYARDVYYFNAAEYMLEDGALPDFFAVYLRGTDDVQHGFWKFMEPEFFDDVEDDQVRRFGEVIEKYWQWTDELVGKLLSRFDENTLVVVVSDHGAGPAIGEHRVTTKRYLHLSGSHRDEGIVILNGPGIEAGVTIEGASIYDIAPTLPALYRCTRCRRHGRQVPLFGV